MKIFATVGTGRFDELIKAVDSLKINARLQIGLGKYIPQNHSYFRFAPDLDKHYKWADIVITHGGTSILETLKTGKKVIGMHNQKRSDDHQKQILKELSRQGHLIYCEHPSLLKEAVKKAQKTRFRPYNPPVCKIHEVMNKWLSR